MMIVDVVLALIVLRVLLIFAPILFYVFFRALVWIFFDDNGLSLFWYKYDLHLIAGASSMILLIGYLIYG